ncbi:ATP-binding protein [Protofrankia symbiont of Coriaria ruscifolia]|uniref:ATP-binding protein n=1 Tax=Protofrankia symbiont of Coriaria ruscifolia TaxID=1306542 RepID=UPI0010412DF0|nr:ATP-binding protein [Protofrankia symbiont of Coriaria ruscifolia]
MTVLAERPAQVAMTRPPRPELRVRSEMQLAALSTATVCAQLFTKYTLQAWRLDHLIEPVEKLTTELVTRAVRTTGIIEPNPRWTELDGLKLILVRLVVLGDNLIVEVADSDPEFTATGGDIPLTRSLGKRWNYYKPPAGGKIVWCELPLSASSSSLDQTQEIPRVLPRRTRKPVPKGVEPIEVMNDPGMLRRVMDGLRNLDGESGEGTT